MKYITVSEIKSETQVFKHIYLFDFFFLFAYIGLTAILSGIVPGQLKVWFWIFSVICAFILIAPSAGNKKRRNYQAIIIFLRKDRKIYKPIPYIAYKEIKK